MSLVENYHAEHLARLARMAPKPKEPPRVVIVPYSHNAGWEGMWFADLVSDRPYPTRPAKIEEIQRAVINHFGITKLELLSKRRPANIVWPRQIAMYLCTKLTTRSLPEIGRKFGGKDHTTILHAARKIERCVNADDSLRAEIAAIRNAIL